MVFFFQSLSNSYFYLLLPIHMNICQSDTILMNTIKAQFAQTKVFD